MALHRCSACSLSRRTAISCAENSACHNHFPNGMCLSELTSAVTFSCSGAGFPASSRLSTMPLGNQAGGFDISNNTRALQTSTPITGLPLTSSHRFAHQWTENG